jgi:hypothetical protein
MTNSSKEETVKWLDAEEKLWYNMGERFPSNDYEEDRFKEFLERENVSTEVPFNI